MSEFDKKLAHAIILLPLHEAAALIDAFMCPFPSLGGVDPATLLASVTSTYDAHFVEDLGEGEPDRDLHQEVAKSRIKQQLDAASAEGEWSGSATWASTDTGSPLWWVTLAPYSGGRRLSIDGRIFRTELYYESGLIRVTIDCLERPSLVAMRLVIAWMQAHPQWVVSSAWGEEPKSEPEIEWVGQQEAIAYALRVIANAAPEPVASLP